MSINWGKVAKIGLNIAGTIIPQVHVIEQVAGAAAGVFDSKSKEDAAVALAKTALEGAEAVAGKELVNDPAFDAAMRSFVKSYVAIQNVIATRADTAANTQ